MNCVLWSSFFEFELFRSSQDMVGEAVGVVGCFIGSGLRRLISDALGIRSRETATFS